ncbi:MAG: carbohydrate binding domain-containing protein, partial [Anaerolineae bacterium]
MKIRRLIVCLVLMVSILFNPIVLPFSSSPVAAADAVMVDMVDDFESGLPSGIDGDGIPIGFYTWGDTWNGTTVNISTVTVPDTDPMALPGQTGDNALLQVDSNVVEWGGLTHHFENGAVDTWVPQDWSSYEGISFWLYGNNSGTTVFFEVQDNRNPGSTADDTEIWNYTFTDDFAGWQRFQIPFSDFVRKDIGNGAPNDGFSLTEVHGWAFGSLNTGGAVTYYLDDVALIVRTTVVDDFESGLPSGIDGDGIPIGFYTW